MDFLAPPDAGQSNSDAGLIEQAYFSHQGRVVHKWHHYLPLDDRYFGDYRNAARPVRMLEIGTAEGGSLELWRGYFGADATIFGIDINPQSATGNGETGRQNGSRRPVYPDLDRRGD